MSKHENNNNQLEVQYSSVDTEQPEIYRDTVELKQQLPSKQLWFSTILSNRRRTFYITLLLLFIVSSIAVVAIRHYTTQNHDDINHENEEISADEYENKNLAVNTEKLRGNSPRKPVSNNQNLNEDEKFLLLRSGSTYRKPESPKKLGHTNIYIRKPTHDGARRRPKQFRFPVAEYNRRQFPLVGPFLSFLPQVSIFADRLTRQTIIFAPTGGVYILPPLINFYGKMFSVAELIASGYASLVSSGVPPVGSINMMPYFQPVPLFGAGIPTINPMTGGFVGGIQTDYESFDTDKYQGKLVDIDPPYETEEEEEDYDRSPSYSKDNYYKRPSRPEDGIADIEWGACTDPFLAPTPAECGFLSVPLDYDDPTGTKIQLGIARINHTVPDNQYKGILVIQPGGPGEAGLIYAAFGQVLPDAVSSFYDVIGFDQRGLGTSKPALSCQPDYFVGPRRNYNPRNRFLEDYWLTRSRNYAKACARNNGELLKHMTTIDTAKDIDRIRKALGQDTLNFYGFSYGTYVGQVYATLFPKEVDRMILDSNIDYHRIWFQANLDVNPGLERNLKLWFDFLAKYDSVFHLGTTRKQVSHEFNKVLKQLETEPANDTIGPDEWLDIFRIPPYYQPSWSIYGQAFSQWVHDSNFTLLLQFYAASDLPGNDNPYAVALAVVCTDTKWPRNWKYIQEEYRRSYKKSPTFTWQGAWFFGPCQYWPVQAHVPVKVNGKGIGDILLIGETLDASTPFRNDLEVRRLFPHARLIGVPGGTTHTGSRNGNVCDLKYIAEYLASDTLPTRKQGDTYDIECSPESELGSLPLDEAGVTPDPDNKWHKHRFHHRRREPVMY